MSIEIIEQLGMRYRTSKSKRKENMCLGKCHCGNKFILSIKDITSGNTNSCGCVRDGRSLNKFYQLYRNMVERCYNPNNNRFNDWGGRGIKICNQWLNNPFMFYDWCESNGYANGLQLDRIDNDKNYTPNNCRFVEPKINNRNQRKRKDNTTNFVGIKFHKIVNRYQSSITVDGKFISLKYFDKPIDAAIARDTYIIKNNLHYQGFKTQVL